MPFVSAPGVPGMASANIHRIGLLTGPLRCVSMIRNPNCRGLSGRKAPVPGFTLIELLVTITIACVLLAVVGPAMDDVLTERAVVSQASELAEALRCARSEAMKRGAPVTVCKLPAEAVGPGTPRCATTPSTSWENWAVFAERTGSGEIGAIDPGEPVLRRQSPSPGRVVYGADNPAALRFVTFQSTGIAVANAWSTTVRSGGSQALVITVNPASPSAGTAAFNRHVRQVCLNAQGRTAVIDGESSCR